MFRQLKHSSGNGQRAMYRTPRRGAGPGLGLRAYQLGGPTSDSPSARAGRGSVPPRRSCCPPPPSPASPAGDRQGAQARTGPIEDQHRQRWNSMARTGRKPPPTAPDPFPARTQQARRARLHKGWADGPFLDRDPVAAVRQWMGRPVPSHRASGHSAPERGPRRQLARVGYPGQGLLLVLWGDVVQGLQARGAPEGGSHIP